jgi:hypothetical protein
MEDEDQKHLFLNYNKITSLVEKITNKLEVMKLPKLNEENIILGWDPKISKKQNLEFANVIYNYKWIVLIVRPENRLNSKHCKHMVP